MGLPATTATTVAGLVHYLTAALTGTAGQPDVAVYDCEPDWDTNPDGTPNLDGPTYPYLVVSLFVDDRELFGPGLRWGPKGGKEPNMYSFAYVDQRVDAKGISKRAIYYQMLANLERIHAAFDGQAARTLLDPGTGQARATMAGKRVTVKLDRQGPYINYLLNLHMGCYGLIEVVENMTQFTPT